MTMPNTHIHKCERCLKPQREELYPILATYLLELVHIDFLTIENPHSGKDVNVLVMIDYFTIYTQVTVTRSQTAQATARALWNNFIPHFGLPASIISDKEHNVESDLIHEICELAQERNCVLLPIIQRESDNVNALTQP